jgi:hypothetical protein
MFLLHKQYTTLSNASVKIARPAQSAIFTILRATTAVRFCPDFERARDRTMPGRVQRLIGDVMTCGDHASSKFTY